MVRHERSRVVVRAPGKETEQECQETTDDELVREGELLADSGSQPVQRNDDDADQEEVVTNKADDPMHSTSVKSP